MDNLQDKHLYRSRTDRMVFGVCGGLGEYLGIDPTILRLIFAGLVVLGFGSGLVLYVVMGLLMRQEPCC
jgi:phage shock protein PspC (stress-responsive transcriptional regulator)